MVMQDRKRGLIINMSSLMCKFPIPYLVVYSALKAFLVSFTRGLSEEAKENNITVQCVVPGIVTTKFSGVRKTNFLVTDPETYAKATLRSTGLEVISFGPLTYRLQATAINFFDNYIHEYFARNFAYNFMNNYRLKAIKRNNKIAGCSEEFSNEDYRNYKMFQRVQQLLIHKKKVNKNNNKKKRLVSCLKYNFLLL
ncbi:hypothetical protein Anas_12145, partial [Armadillidium nasatum]